MIYFMQKGRLEELLIAEEKLLMLLDILKSYKTLDASQYDMLKRLFTNYVEEVEETSKQKQSKAKQTKQ